MMIRKTNFINRFYYFDIKHNFFLIFQIIYKLIRKIDFLYFLLFLSFFFSANLSFADNANIIRTNLYKSIINPEFNEINKIEFEGVDKLDSELLSDIIASKATENNLPYQLFVSFYREFEKNPSMIKALNKQFKKGLLELRDEVPFFDKLTAEGDLISIQNFYEINGFHFAKITYEFKPNPKKIENILVFHIQEGDKYVLDSIVYNGLDKVAPEITDNLIRYTSFNKGSDFNEVKLDAKFERINQFLRTKGYYYSSYSRPKVELDTVSKTDKIYVDYEIGNRFKVGRIDFVDSSNGQQLISREMKKKQLDFHSGEWVNYTKIERTKDNLLTLGTFEIVAIDTTSQYAPQNDSVLNFQSYLLYRKEQEMNFGISLNQTRIDNYVNLGFETYYRHRNLFGAAQEFSPFANVYLKDLGTFISNNTYEYEAQAGFKYAQPLLWNIGSSKVSFLSSFLFSYKLLNNYFKISSFIFPVSFPVKFAKITYFNRANVDFNFLRENPVNFDEAQRIAFKSAKTEQDSNNIFQALLLYGDLSKYIQGSKFYFFTSNTIGLSLTGDTRNNPFSPTSGYFTLIGIDGWNPLFFMDEVSGLARFFKFQFNHNHFFKLTPTTVLALKGKFGGIELLENGNNYVPIDRQFFCGGPNSVRAWPSRQLRYTQFKSDSINSGTLYKFLENFVGNGALVEGSIEFRFGFARIPGLNRSLQSAMENFKTTLFLDFGNAFHWFVEDSPNELKFTDYFTKLALGTGIGLRYETPIGPVRLDFAFPLIDPLKERKPFSTMQFNFGIGQAF